jgi:ubiquinone/menaquinone biosynthesis C-methylase UbiE
VIGTSFDQVAPEYASDGTFFTQIAAHPAGRAGVRPGHRVLDAGCGTGIFTLAAARAAGPAGHVAGIDLSGAMLRRAQACRSRPGGANIALARADAHAPPFPPGSFDLVASSMVMFLLAEPARAVRAWAPLLRPGGTLAFSWNVSEDPGWRPVIAAVDAHVSGSAAGGFEALLHHPPFSSPDEVRAMLAAAGYGDISTTVATVESAYSGPRHWWATSWSSAPRLVWRHIPQDRRPAARGDAFRLLEAMRLPDGTLCRRSRIGFTVAHRCRG